MAAIDLRESVLDETRLMGEVEIVIPAGKSLKIETSPGGEEILDVECPEGKVWSALVFVRLVQTDV